LENRFILIGKINNRYWTVIYTLRKGAIRIISVRRSRKKERISMKKKNLAKTNEEFDRRFDQGEDIQKLIDLCKATISRPGKKVRITLDISESLVKEIDSIRETIGVERGALIKVWLHDRVKKEKAGQVDK
jgi:hypothetical protein